MAHIVLMGNLRQYTGGEAEFDLDARTVRQLFTMLSDRHPTLKPHLAEGLAVAIDGQIYQDAWLEEIEPKSEVHLLPQIAGG